VGFGVGFGVGAEVGFGVGAGVAGGVSVQREAKTYVPLTVLYQPLAVMATTSTGLPASSSRAIS
jgi:hypothetical protein